MRHIRESSDLMQGNHQKTMLKPNVKYEIV